ncbi:MAG: 3-oxoacyl-[acyl-carrier-protein] synthase-3 [Myxococcota bacterium]|jgi:3-oxoacyl-[acyl-carrier-protein] synthase-3
MISLAGTASYFPERVVENSFFQAEGTRPGRGMFKGSRTRHHVDPEQTAPEMIERAATRLLEQLNLSAAADIDLILTNVSCLDMPFTGSGAVVAHRLGANPKLILDVHNSGCVSFVYMMELARSLMQATGARTALICNVQNAAGRVFSHPDNRVRPQSAVPGDGCGVGLLTTSGESPVTGIVTHSHGAYAEDMQVVSDDGKKWWEPRTTPLYINFNPERVAKVVARGNTLVPDVVRESCAAAGVPVSALKHLITNQPSPIFLRNWREALLMSEAQHINTYEEHGNLFGAAIPVSFERGLDTGRIQKGDHVALGGFSHAGDYSAAAVVHWQGGVGV